VVRWEMKSLGMPAYAPMADVVCGGREHGVVVVWDKGARGGLSQYVVELMWISSMRLPRGCGRGHAVRARTQGSRHTMPRWEVTTPPTSKPWLAYGSRPAVRAHLKWRSDASGVIARIASADGSGATWPPRQTYA
jgi:hypothetical protein